jgi:hypothetical protein
MNRIQVSSSNISSIGYDSLTFVLEIEFTSGGIYQYIGVPQAVYSSLMAANSHGSYFAAHIKDVYRTVKTN